jgi:serine protease Do
MLKKFAAMALGAAALSAGADTIQLKEGGSISGKILAEKPDQLAVDVGYTVLVIPRNQVVTFDKSDALETPSKSNSNSKTKPHTQKVSSPAAESASGGGTASGGANFYGSASKAGAARSVRDLVTILGESVVQVRTPGGLGSGFFINEDGFLITNFHVIEGETQISIEVYHQKNGQLDRKTYKQVRIIAINKYGDLALLKVAVNLGSAEALAVGERVFAIGSPLGLERTVTEGILSTKTRQMAGELYLQTTAQINPGNSGGPLFNMNGDVVGVTNMKITFGEGLGFAIFVDAVKFFLDHRDAFAYSNDNPGNAYRYLEPPSRTRQNVVAD